MLSTLSLSVTCFNCRVSRTGIIIADLGDSLSVCFICQLSLSWAGELDGSVVRALAAVAEGPCSVPITYMEPHKCRNSSSRAPETLFCSLETHVCRVHTYTEAHIHRKVN